MIYTAKVTGTKVTTGLIRMSYVHVFEPSAMQGNDPKYSICVLIPKTDHETLRCVKEAVEAAKEMGKAKLGGKIAPNLKTPLREGDERPDHPEYQDMMFLNASSKNKPGVVDADVHPVIDPSEVYSGCYGRLTINFYAYSQSGNKGIAAGLGNVQKLQDGDTLSGGATAEEDFGAAKTAAKNEFLGA